MGKADKIIERCQKICSQAIEKLKKKNMKKKKKKVTIVIVVGNVITEAWKE